jgi:PGF-pre-PGF domain-containing protein
MPAGDAGGSVASISPGTPAGTEITYSFDDPSLSTPLIVDRVSLVPGQAVPESRCTVRQESPLPDFRLHGGPALYNDIEISWISPSAISEARISFDVTKTWLDANHIDPADVVLMRQHNRIWAELPTTFDRQEDGRYYYTATTPGFSYFAVTDKKTAAAAKITATMTATPAPVNTPAPVVAIPSSSTPVPVRVAAVHARALLTTTETPVPAPHMAEPETGLPLPWIAVAALISMLGIAGFFIGRRLWWEHQNPTLFRDYD